MKNINKILSILFVSATLFSCTEYVDGINEDPDNLIDADAKNLFQGAVLGNQFFQTSSVVRSAMIWMNQANGEDRQYVALNNWNNSVAAENDDSWNNAYVNCLAQSRLVQQKATKSLSPRIVGAAQVVEASCMGTVTQLWGDIPYSKFDVNGGNLTPTFDGQVQVYAALQLLLDKAIANLSLTSGNAIPAAKDVNFAGDALKWKSLAYSLKARFYLHVKNYPLAKVNALLGINNSANDFNAIFTGVSAGQDVNPYNTFLNDRDSYMSGDSYAARLLDPTSPLYRGNSKTNESDRFDFNYYDGGVFAPYSLNDSKKYAADANLPLVTYGEMLLIIAEVDARTSFAAGLSSYNSYRAALSGSYGYPATSYLPYVAADFATGGMENNTLTVLTNQNALLREIYQERYVYFIGNFESYTDYGRTNNIAEIKLKPGFVGSPQRFIYPQVEINSNGANVPNPLPKVTQKTTVNL